LEVPFIEEEIKKVVLRAPEEKAPGQMDLLVYFFKVLGDFQE
jgi:hypothetical protein